MSTASTAASASPSSRAQPIRLRLLERPCLLLPEGKEHSLWASDAALLMLLARRGPQERDEVALLIWPGRPLAVARTSLRQRDHRLGRAAGRPLLTKHGALALAPDVAHDLDDAMPSLTADPWSLQVPLLAGLVFAGQPELAEAVQTERERWHAALCSVVRQCAQAHEQRGEVERALEYARRLVREEPTSEHAGRLLMQLHHRNADRGQALAAFDELKQRLDQHLGESPSAQTLDLARQIENQTVPGPTPSPGLPMALRHPPRTCGRESVTQAMRQRLLEGRITVLVGSAGVGKTRVFDDLVKVQACAVVCRVQPECRDEPLALLRLMACALVTQLPPGHRGQDEPALVWLAGGSAQTDAQTGVMSSARAAGALRSALDTLDPPAAAGGSNAGAPTLVAVDDLHFADAESLDWVLRLLDRPAALSQGRPWLLTSRDGEMPEPLRAWLSLQPEHDEARFDLAPLTPDQVHELLADVLAASADRKAWASALAAHCGGHPLTVLQVLRALHGGGQLDDPRPPAVLPVPREATQRVARRLESQDTRTQQLAYAAALCGGDFSVDVAMRVMASSATELSVAWRKLQALGLMRDGHATAELAVAGGAMPAPGAYTHELVRQSVADMVPADLAPAMHHEIAQALQAEGVPPVRRLRHWVAAGRWAEAARDAAATASQELASGLRSAARASWLDAAAWFERAGDGGGAFEARAEAVPLTLSILSADQARSEAEALHAQARGTRQRCLALVLRSQVLSDQRHPVALDLALQAKELACQAGDTLLRMRAQLRESVALYAQGRYPEALSALHAARAQTEADKPPREADRAELVCAQALILAQLGRRREATAIFLHEYRSARRRHDLARTAEHLSDAAVQLGFLCRIESAWRRAEAALALDARIGSVLAYSAVNEATVAAYALDTGRYTRALEMGERCVASLRRSGFAHHTVSAENNLAGAYLQLGRDDLAHKLLADAPEAAPVGARALRRAAQGALARARGGSALPALLDAQRQLQAAGALSEPYVRWRIAIEVARWSQTRADTEAALATAGEVTRWAAGVQHLALQQQALQVQAEALLRLGRFDEAAASADALRQQCGPGLARFAVYGVYLPERWWILVSAWDAVGRRAEADAAVRHAEGWIRERAAQHMPPVFRESFLTRNRTNAAVLARAALSARAGT